MEYKPKVILSFYFCGLVCFIIACFGMMTHLSNMSNQLEQMGRVVEMQDKEIIHLKNVIMKRYPKAKLIDDDDNLLKSERVIDPENEN